MPHRPLIFDDTALTALFEGHPRVYALWRAAEANSTVVLLPAAAMLTANQQLMATDNAWFALLLQSNVTVLDLTAAVAMQAGRFGAEPAIAQCYVEAIHSNAVIITSRREAYGPANVVVF